MFIFNGIDLALRIIATPPATQPPIASIADGPIGLTLLLTLHERSIPAILYEREPGFASRSHLGGFFDLGRDTGLRALQDNDLEKQWQANSRPEGDSNRLCDGQKLLISFGHGDNQYLLALRLETDRSTLHQTMLDALYPDVVKWGHALSASAVMGSTS